MPRFYFHIVGKVTKRDDVGTELPSEAYAKREGVRFVGALLSEGLFDHQDGSMLLEVTDETGNILFHLDLLSWEAPKRQAA